MHEVRERPHRCTNEKVQYNTFQDKNNTDYLVRLYMLHRHDCVHMVTLWYPWNSIPIESLFAGWPCNKFTKFKCCLLNSEDVPHTVAGGWKHSLCLPGPSLAEPAGPIQALWAQRIRKSGKTTVSYYHSINNIPIITMENIMLRMHRMCSFKFLLCRNLKDNFLTVQRLSP